MKYRIIMPPNFIPALDIIKDTCLEWDLSYPEYFPPADRESTAIIAEINSSFWIEGDEALLAFRLGCKRWSDRYIVRRIIREH